MLKSPLTSVLNTTRQDKASSSHLKILRKQQILHPKIWMCRFRIGYLELMSKIQYCTSGSILCSLLRSFFGRSNFLKDIFWNILTFNLPTSSSLGDFITRVPLPARWVILSLKRIQSKALPSFVQKYLMCKNKK